MAITSAIVLLAVIWFMTFFIILPLRLTTQGDVGDVVPGTQPSAPTDPKLKRKAKLVTAIAVPIWAIVCAIILTRTITVADFDLYHRFGPESRQAVKTGADLANPAAVFCVESGGEHLIEIRADGEYGFCVLPDGRKIDEWEYLRENQGAGGQPSGN